MKRLKELKARDDATNRILCALSTDEQLPETLKRLKGGENYDAIVGCLEEGVRHDMDALSKESK